MDLMSLTVFFNDFRTLIILVACLMAYVVRPYDSNNRRLHYLFIYLILTLASNIIAYSTRGMGNNIYLSYIISPISLVLLTFLMMPSQAVNKTKMIIWILVALCATLNIYEGFLMDGGVQQFNSLSNTFSSIFLGALAIWGLIRLRFDQSILNLSKEPMFWVFIAFAITNVGNILTTAFYRYAQSTDTNLLVTIAFVSILVSYISIGLVCIGFWKIKRR